MNEKSNIIEGGQTAIAHGTNVIMFTNVDHQQHHQIAILKIIRSYQLTMRQCGKIVPVKLLEITQTYVAILRNSYLNCNGNFPSTSQLLAHNLSQYNIPN